MQLDSDNSEECHKTENIAACDARNGYCATPVNVIGHAQFLPFCQSVHLAPYQFVPFNPSMMLDQYGQVHLLSESDISHSFFDKSSSAIHRPRREDAMGQTASMGNAKYIRKRSAHTNELILLRRLEESSSPYNRIRVWKNENDSLFYDCDCGKRKPLQDLKKIKKHVDGHLVRELKCDCCGKNFRHHLQLNAHKRVHKVKKTLQEESPSS